MPSTYPSAVRRLLLLLFVLFAAGALACRGDEALDDPEAAASAVGDSQATASLSRQDLAPLLQAAQLQPEDLPGTWEARDLAIMDGSALAAQGGQQTQVAQAVIDACLAPRPEGGSSGPDAGVVRTFLSDSAIGAVISTVARAGDGAARTVEALRRPVTEEMKGCVEGEVRRVLGAVLQNTEVEITELRHVPDLPYGSGANVLSMTLGAGGSAFIQRIVTAAVARDGLLNTSVEVVFGAGQRPPEPPLPPERLAEAASRRLEEALTAHAPR